MKKVFNNGSSHDKRKIMIEIEEEAICFYFFEQYLRQENYLQVEAERRSMCGEDDLTEDEKRNDEFYWIDKDEWRRNVNNWHNHMEEKNWFTNEMKEWMDDNCNK